MLLLLAAVGFAGGGSLVWVGLEPAGRATQVVGPNLPVDAARATDPLDTTATNSPSLVANPRDPSQLVLVSRVDTPQFSCSLQLSSDAGSTWHAASIPVAPGNHSISCFAPDTAFGPDGVLYLSFSSVGPVVGQGPVPDAVWVTTSHDGGRTFGDPVQTGGPLAFQVRLAADSRMPGRAYVTWLQAAGASTWGLAGTANPIVAARSDDGGATWSQPARVSPVTRSLVVAPTPVATDDGVLVAYVDVGDDRLDYAGAHEGRGGPPYGGSWSIVVARSADGAREWSEVTLGQVTPTQRFRQLFPPTPAITVAGRRAYVAFADGSRGDADVWLWASADTGQHWSSATRVDDARQGDQYFPAVAIAPDGRVDVLYYDRRADPQGSRNEVSLQSSSDGGRSFSPRVRVSDRSFDAGIGYGADRGMPELGSRLAVIATDDGTLAVWTDTRASSEATTHQDLARAVVASGEATSGRGGVVGSGAVLALAAAALGVGAWRAGRRL